VNFLGHTHVALAAGSDDPAYLLGAALPDLAPMAGVRLARGGLDGALAAGVRCHLAADAAFHAHAVFRAGSGALRRTLTDRGVASGPARAVGHAGWELLLDGTLVGTAVEDAFRRSLAVGEEVLPVLAPDDRPRWTRFLARVRASSGLRYDEPRWVAERLHGMLAHRPRLRLPDRQVTTVAEALAAAAGPVAAVATAVLDDTAVGAGAGRNVTPDG
jgi:hypothetical protein